MTDGEHPGQTIRIAAAGDVHCREDAQVQGRATFARLRGEADLLLLAGDLTTHGRPEQAAVLADACSELDMPVYAVLGNHDWHADRADELVATLSDAGIAVLERQSATCRAGGIELGIVGLKGFVGGFAGSHLSDFGEPQLRALYRSTSEDVEALDAGLREIAMCHIRVVLLHYAPTSETLEGEPPGIWTYLGTDRLASPIREHEPTLVLHGHAHAGRFEGAIGGVPVYNVSVPVMERDFWIFELEAPRRAAAGHGLDHLR